MAKKDKEIIPTDKWEFGESRIVSIKNKVLTINGITFELPYVDDGEYEVKLNYDGTVSIYSVNKNNNI